MSADELDRLEDRLRGAAQFVSPEAKALGLPTAHIGDALLTEAADAIASLVEERDHAVRERDVAIAEVDSRRKVIGVLLRYGHGHWPTCGAPEMAPCTCGYDAAWKDANVLASRVAYLSLTPSLPEEAPKP